MAQIHRFLAKIINTYAGNPNTPKVDVYTIVTRVPHVVSSNPGPNNFENRGNKSRNLSSLINIHCIPSHTIQRQLISMCLLNIRSFKKQFSKQHSKTISATVRPI